MEEELPL